MTSHSDGLRRLRNFINGEYVDSVDGRTAPVVNPATGEAYAEAPVSTRFRYLTDVAYSRSGKDSGKEMKQAAYVPPCPEWYGDREWNVNLWGTYAFTNTEFAVLVEPGQFSGCSCAAW